MCRYSMYYWRRLALAALACSVPLMVANRPVCASEPEGVVRTFLVFLSGDPVDFLHEDSVMVKAGKSTSAPLLLEFVDFNDPALSEFDFDGTLWATGPAMYITKGNGLTEIGTFAWLIDEQTPEPPPAGSHTLTGPDALLVQETVLYSVCSGNCGSGNDDKLTLDRFGSGRLVVVTAVFDR